MNAPHLCWHYQHIGSTSLAKLKKYWSMKTKILRIKLKLILGNPLHFVLPPSVQYLRKQAHSKLREIHTIQAYFSCSHNKFSAFNSLKLTQDWRNTPEGFSSPRLIDNHHSISLHVDSVTVTLICPIAFICDLFSLWIRRGWIGKIKWKAV